MRLLVYNRSTVESTKYYFFHFPAFILEYFDLFKFLITACLAQNLASSDRTENVYLQNKSQQGARKYRLLLQKRMLSIILSCLNNAHPVHKTKRFFVTKLETCQTMIILVPKSPVSDVETSCL